MEGTSRDWTRLQTCLVAASLSLAISIDNSAALQVIRELCDGRWPYLRLGRPSRGEAGQPYTLCTHIPTPLRR